MADADYTSPADNQGPLLNRVSIAQYAVAVVFVLLRFFTRGCIVKKFGLDDLLIAIAVVLGGAQTATLILQVENGRGRHSSDLPEDEFNRMLMYKWINLLIYFAANWAVKMSILALYYRIGSGKRRLPLIVQPRIIWWTAGAMTAFHVAAFTAQFFACIPVSRAWDVQRLPLGCFNGPLFMRISGAINVATDVILVLLPLPLLRLLQFSKRQRTALAFVLSIGLIPVVASTMRLCEIVMSAPIVTKDQSWQQLDSSWRWAWIPVWSQIEVDVGILAASLPSLSPLLKHVRASFSTTKVTTLSQMQTLPGYRRSWDARATSTASERDVEKELGEMERGSQNDLLDVENGVQGARNANRRPLHGEPINTGLTKI